MTKHFPPIDRNYTFLQPNRGDILGNLWASYGLDFQSNLGAIRAGEKLVINTGSADDADLGLPCAFESFSSRYWAICGTRVFKSASDESTGAFSEDTSTNFATDYSEINSDLKVFNDRLWATTTDALLSKDTATGTWTVREALNGSTLHKFAYFKKFNRLYVTNTTSDICSMSDDMTFVDAAGDYYISLADAFGSTFGRITTIEASSDSIWIGTMVNSRGTIGAVYRWDGISSQITAEYRLASAGVVAMKVVNDIPYIIDTYGRILRLEATGFEEFARFPTDGNMFLNAMSDSETRFVHYNGIELSNNNTLLIGLNPTLLNLNSSIPSEKMSAGVWELDLSNGNLTHKHPFSLKKQGDTSITDYGQPYINKIGAIKLNTLYESDTLGRPEMLVGAGQYTDNTTTAHAIFIQSALATTEKQKVAYFVTQWMKSDDIEDNWLSLCAVYRRFLDSTDKIVFKYRLEEVAPVYASITWVNTTSFTTTTDVTAYTPSALEAEIGGEVEILRGTGGGASRHIVSVTNNAGTYTVVLDNAVTGVTTGTARARFQKWIKMTPEITGQVNSYTKMPIAKNSPRIQVKGVLEFTGDNEFYKFMLYNTPFLKAQA